HARAARRDQTAIGGPDRTVPPRDEDLTARAATPLARSSITTPTPLDAMDGITEQRRPRLLAIDDSTMVHRLLKARLRSERLEIHSATTGAQGLETARTLLPEVILLDVDMPDMDGYAVLVRLQPD